MWLTIKYTWFGKIGAALITGAPILFAVEIGSHIDALIAALPPTAAVIMGVFALRRGQKTMMVNIDGRMHELLQQTSKASHLEGKEQERSESRDRRDEIKVEIAKKSGEPSKVTVVNEPSNPANVKVGNLSTDPVPTTIAEKQEKIAGIKKEIEEQKKE